MATEPPPEGAQKRHRRKQQVLTHGSASMVSSIADAVVIKQGEPFFLCPPDGQIGTSGDHGFGLYHHDTRFLSGYELRVHGKQLDSLGATAPAGAEAILELTNPELQLDDGRTFPKERLGIRWRRRLEDDPPKLTDRIDVRNHSGQPLRLRMRFEFAADFRDVFEVRGLISERLGQPRQPRATNRGFEFGYDGRDGVSRTLAIELDRALSAHHGSSGELTLNVPAYGHRSIRITLRVDEEVAPGAAPLEPRAQGQMRSIESRSRRSARRGKHPGEDPGWSTSFACDALVLEQALGRSLIDLVTLRDALGGQRYYAAGVPWFSTLFGRDSIITALQTLAFEPAVAAETLRLLAARQGTMDDEWRDEEPGKILHELRVGELARLNEIPHTPYYGSVDSTPLFLVLLARHAAWTGSLELFRELRDHVDEALGWMDRCSGRNGGYLAYESPVEKRLVNQGWKDSGDAIVRADGTIARPPIALVEVQGYMYQAKQELADLFERDGDPDRAERLRREAADLARRFERDFWSDDLGGYILALSADQEPCAVMSSNAGQVLWSGIASADRATATARRLLAADMFSGWGIRTLSSEARAWNPVGYHLGTVWPHDNALIVEGLRRYGHDDEAERVLTGIVTAAQDFSQNRLPECFAGFDRSTFGIPVRYPIACHPQAWAAGAVPHLVQTTLGLRPEAFDGRLRVVRPRLPKWINHLQVRGLRVGRGQVDLSFDRSDGTMRASVDRVRGGLEVRIEDGSEVDDGPRAQRGGRRDQEVGR